MLFSKHPSVSSPPLPRSLPPPNFSCDAVRRRRRHRRRSNISCSIHPPPEHDNCEERAGRSGPIPHLPRRRAFFVYSLIKNNFGKAPINTFPATRRGEKGKTPQFGVRGGWAGGRDGKGEKKREKFDDILRCGSVRVRQESFPWPPYSSPPTPLPTRSHVLTVTKWPETTCT